MRPVTAPPYIFSGSDPFNRFLPALSSCERLGRSARADALCISGEVVPLTGLLPLDGIEVHPQVED